MSPSNAALAPIEPAPPAASAPAPPESDDAERLRRFGERLDAIRARVEAELGATDVAHVKKLRAFSTAMEVAGRALIHVSLDPVTFTMGVVALWLHKQLEATEIGHSALHGQWDGLPGAEAFASKTFHWKVPIEEDAWRSGHNVKHHQYTNIAGKDPDVEFGPIRLTARTPHEPKHYFQVPIALATATHFAAGMNLHFVGLVNPTGPVDRDAAWRQARSKFVPYYLRELVLFPALAGPLFAKVLLGNWLSELMRDLYSAATIYCGHIGDDVADYAPGTRAHGRADWYRMQVGSANNFEVPLPVSMLCGALDRQIEHHLFPRFPPNRLREIAPEVRAACVEAGIEYRTDSWGGTLRQVLGRLWRLSFADAKA
jgi:fatty acid desaturase